MSDNAIPHFFMKAKQDKAQSREQGRPIFRDVEYIEVRIPGDSKTVFVAKVTDEHKQRWPEAYQAFKNGQEVARTGTPLEQWPHPQLSVSKVAELKGLNIYSVEDLAGLNESFLDNIGMGARSLQQAAQAYLDAASGSAEANRIIHENEQLRSRVGDLERQVKELAAMAQKEDDKPKRGRPRKDAA